MSHSGFLVDRAQLTLGLLSDAYRINILDGSLEVVESGLYLRVGSLEVGSLSLNSGREFVPIDDGEEAILAGFGRYLDAGLGDYSVVVARPPAVDYQGVFVDDMGHIGFNCKFIIPYITDISFLRGAITRVPDLALRPVSPRSRLLGLAEL